MQEYVLAISTCPEKMAEEIALKLVKNRDCASVNIIRGITSFFHWEGQIEQTTEALLLMRTEKHLVEKLSTSLKEAHPYHFVEFVVVPIQWGLKDYLDWISRSIQQP